LLFYSVEKVNVCKSNETKLEHSRRNKTNKLELIT